MTGWAAVAAICVLGMPGHALQSAGLEACITEERAAADRPVDDYIREINKQKRKRNPNPLPEYICIWGWCRQVRKPGEDSAPPHPPAPAEPGTAPSSGGDPATSHKELPSGDGHSSSRQPVCLPLYDPIRAAEHVEVGDHYSSRRNYRAALSRYQEALENKPADPAIHLRLGRTLEKMEEPAQAYVHYELSLRSPQDGPWKKEAEQALARLGKDGEGGPAVRKR